MARTLDPIREKLQPLIEQANAIYTYIVDSGAFSQAVYDANRSSKSGEAQFNITDKHRYREIKREVRRAEQFLRDAKAENWGAPGANPENWKGKFGNQYKSEYGKSYSPELNDDIANLAFEAYRRVESDLAAELENYGSENLVSFLYDFISINPSLLFADEKERIERIQLAAQQSVIDMYYAKSQQAEMERNIRNHEYGVLLESKTAKEFREKLRW